MIENAKQIQKEAIFEEYRILRSEIQQYHAERNNYVNYSVTLTGALLAFISATKILNLDVLILFLLIPYIYFLLGFLFLDKGIRILRLADYIHNHLRKELQNLSHTNIWNWEIYKKQTTKFPKLIAFVLEGTSINA